MKDLILGIESSCDDTCACLMSFTDGHIEYNKSIHQDEIHSQYGGIVPNLAAGEHLKHFEIIKKDLKQHDLMRIAAVACTIGPGLIGSLIVGTSFAKGVSMSLGVPLIRVNHLEGHALSCMIENKVDFPYILLLVSGGNSQIILAKKLGEYRVIGRSLDDAGGEAIDKIAKNLGIDYPGGVNMEKIALLATNASEFKFKDGCINNLTFDFSFSGLKTQVLYKIRELGGQENIDDKTRSNLAYAAQEAVFMTFEKKINQIMKKDQEIIDLISENKIKNLVICGGVSANKRLSQIMMELCKKKKFNLVVPSLKWTTDNAGMIAKAGCMYFNAWKKEKRNFKYNPLDLSFSPVAKLEIGCI
jgi:N6-L-threonylcarbamoyladenine synthase